VTAPHQPTYPSAGYPATAPNPPAGDRPLTLTLAFWLSAVVGLLGIVGGIFDITGGKAAINKALGKEGIDSDLARSVAGAALDSAYHTLVTRAVIAIVAGALVLAFALAARSGATWARITLTVFLAFGICAGSGLQLRDHDVLPSISLLAASLSPLLSLVAIVLLFLPATNRYAKRGKTATL
jgi:hypothetical protein